MLRIRNLLVVIPIMLASLMAAGPVSAEPQYPPTIHGTLNVSPKRVQAGRSVTAMGRGFANGTEVTVMVTCRGRTTVKGTVPVRSRSVAKARIKLSKACTWTISFWGVDKRGRLRMLSGRVVVTRRTHDADAAPSAFAPSFAGPSAAGPGAAASIAAAPIAAAPIAAAPTAAAPTAAEPIAAGPVANTTGALTPLSAGLGLVLAGGAFVGTMRIRRRVRT